MGTHEHFIDLGQDYLLRIASLMRAVAGFSHRPICPSGTSDSMDDPAVQPLCQSVSDLLSIPDALAFEVLQGKVAVKFDAAIVTLTLNDLQKQMLPQG
jgi:hypothetical protein